MKFNEWVSQQGAGKKNWKTVAYHAWQAGVQAEREACAELVSDLVLHRVPASEYAGKIRERGER